MTTATGLCVAACGTPGYMIRMEASGLEQIDPVLLDQLDQEATSSGFAASMKRVKNKSYPFGFTTSYHKEMSSRAHDSISIDILYSGVAENPKKISIVIVDAVGGMAPIAKTQIDSVGDRFYEELTQSVDKSKVSIERRSIRRPIAW